MRQICLNCESLVQTTNQNRSQNSVSWAQNMPKMRWQPGLRPGPRWGSLQRSPDPLAAIRGPTSKGRGGKGKGGKGREGGRGGYRHTNPHLLPAPMTSNICVTLKSGLGPRGRSRSLKIAPFDRPCDFLLVGHCNYSSVLYHFRVF